VTLKTWLETRRAARKDKFRAAGMAQAMSDYDLIKSFHATPTLISKEVKAEVASNLDVYLDAKPKTLKEYFATGGIVTQAPIPDDLTRLKYLFFGNAEGVIPNEYKLPLWEDIVQKRYLQKDILTPLEEFLYDNEPSGEGENILFRDQLQAAIEYALKEK
jgi:hypothetical protein